jgi:hypothetical protein
MKLKNEIPIVGMSFEDAKRYLKQSGVQYRVKCVNGSYNILTRDYKPDRINLTIKDNIIVAFDLG